MIDEWAAFNMRSSRDWRAVYEAGFADNSVKIPGI